MDLTGKKVAIVASVASSFPILFTNQLQAMVASGLKITALSTLDDPRHLEFFEKKGIEFMEIPIKRQIAPLADLRTIFRLCRIFRAKQFDFIHTQTPKPTLLGAIAGKLCGIPVINTARPIFREMPEGFRRNFFIVIEKIAARLTDLVMVENPNDYDLYLGLGIAPKDKLRIQGNGIDLSRFDPEKIPAAETAKLRTELGIPKNGRVIGCVARYVYEKGYGELFEAFRQIKSSHPELYLLCVGFFLPSERDPIPRDLPQKMGIADRVIMLENRSDMDRLYAVMDIIVLPTHRDCFPRSLIEAAAMKKPIIATDLVGCQVVVTPGETGLLIPPKDAHALAEAMLRLVQDSSLAQALAEKARENALKYFNEDAVCRKILDCYSDLLS